MTLPASSAADRADRRVGLTIREKYRLERVLGVGGMATVYSATHRNGSRAALKILHPELAVLDVHRERFIREAYVANSIEHSGAVRVVDDDVAEDNCPFLVMELLEGETLEARRRRLGRLDVREVLALAHSLCDTLAAAHAAGVVHRDIKPENLFLTTSRTLKILDFGIARVRHETGVLGTRTGMMLGTPAFMPPEQALGRRAEIDPRTDLWAAGATMFTLLSGRFVHDADSPEEMMVRAATQVARPLLEVLPDAPLPIAAVVGKALAFKRDERYVTANEMRQAIADVHFEVFAEGIETTSMPAPPQSLPRSSLNLPKAASADVATLAEGEPRNVETLDAPLPLDKAAAPTMVDLGSSGMNGSTGQSSQKSLVATRVEGALRTQRSGEPVPMSTRSKRRGLFMTAAAVLAASVSVFVGIRHVVGRPVETNEVRTACKQNAECAATERCDEQGHCVVASGCASNAGCVAELGGKPAICRHDLGKCVALETDRCRVFSEAKDLQNDETIWIGAMYPERDDSSTYGVHAMRGVELARRDFAELSGGLPPVKPGGRPRPMAIVACDDTHDYERTAEHLIDGVGVPAILGFGRSKEVLELASRQFIPKGIFILASNTASMISSIPHEPGQPRLVYRVTTHADSMAPPRAAVIRDVIEPSLRSSRGPIGVKGTLKIAILRSENASGTSHTDAAVLALEKSAPLSGSSPMDIRSFVFKDSMLRKPDVADKRVIDDVGKFAPHIVFDGGMPHAVLLLIEQRWPSHASHRPSYVVSSTLSSETMQQLGTAHPTMPARLFGIDSQVATDAARMYQVRYRGAFQGTTGDVNGAPYDAFYVFAYTAAALGTSPITGVNLAQAVKRLLPPGLSIDVGPSGIFPAFKELAASRNIDLAGAQTSLDFDLKTGNAAVDFKILCFDRTTKTGKPSGLIYRAHSGRLEGTWKCP
ncbi:MAG TPA: protein kinase [Polyangium sp.]|nr:protein kinase [Polyangium sp.]